MPKHQTHAGRVYRQTPSIAKMLRQAFRVRRQRLDLAQLDDRTLDDIGLTRGQAREEAARSFLDF
ncbi:MAG: DUF1127 domain-containing protein [Hyphomonas sp.]|nr:DUF1127 domain-containing protein [Hyphomonas sp.]